MNDWRQRGACRTADPELFYPISEAAPNQGQIAEAKAVCASCPVLAVCRQHALGKPEPFGVWGGMTEWERERLLRRDRRASHAGRGPSQERHPANV